MRTRHTQKRGGRYLEDEKKDQLKTQEGPSAQLSGPKYLLKPESYGQVSAFLYSVHPDVKITALSADTRHDHAKHKREEV